ncbi:MAG: prepilin-type N-terminal cleavage/methylation domain-containing protein [Blautia sp.]|nr:prepilin-type N-terminal cleavage/methylation domain-containing protein [Blautia sp.]
MQNCFRGKYKKAGMTMVELIVAFTIVMLTVLVWLSAVRSASALTQKSAISLKKTQEKDAAYYQTGSGQLSGVTGDMVLISEDSSDSMQIKVRVVKRGNSKGGRYYVETVQESEKE